MPKDLNARIGVINHTRRLTVAARNHKIYVTDPLPNIAYNCSVQAKFTVHSHHVKWVLKRRAPVLDVSLSSHFWLADSRHIYILAKRISQFFLWMVPFFVNVPVWIKIWNILICISNFCKYFEIFYVLSVTCPIKLKPLIEDGSLHLEHLYSRYIAILDCSRMRTRTLLSHLKSRRDPDEHWTAISLI